MQVFQCFYDLQEYMSRSRLVETTLLVDSVKKFSPLAQTK